MQKGEFVSADGMRRITSLGLAFALVASGVAAFALHAAAAGQVYRISQKGRAFQPSALVIKKGETVQIVNDDGDLLHHAYVDSPNFRYDSGDQEPGGKAEIVFPASGTFAVLCGIHPKMKLAVRVDGN
ncbi:Plastocyanin [Methylobacterium bullatum]|uniref:Plastocyanin n=1 Tax=Methylobacterium bullatum TaxID=570505 RepID=A0A679J0Q5_9HYPH|nr:Plastocyanin [Methylobacterium bullatum]